MNDWQLPGARKDPQTVTSDWQLLRDRLIDGVIVHEAKNVIGGTGRVTELWRSDWALDRLGVDQVFQNVLAPGHVSAWHAHETGTDRLTVTAGQLTIVLYDGRTAAPTHGRVNEFHISAMRPTLLVVPPMIWHGVKNASGEPATLLNLTDHAYTYEDPDHWRLPADTDQIPHRF